MTTQLPTTPHNPAMGTFQHKYSVSGVREGLWGLPEGNYQIDIWENAEGSIFVSILRDGSGMGTKQFRNCETQHDDAERWMNDVIHYPNPFAGLFALGAWR